MGTVPAPESWRPPKYNCEASIMGIWGRSPQWDPGAEPLVRGGGFES